MAVEDKEAVAREEAVLEAERGVVVTEGAVREEVGMTVQKPDLALCGG